MKQDLIGCFSIYSSVFWDLYCAAPERRNQFEVTDEAKLFHDLNVKFILF